MRGTIPPGWEQDNRTNRKQQFSYVGGVVLLIWIVNKLLHYGFCIAGGEEEGTIDPINQRLKEVGTFYVLFEDLRIDDRKFLQRQPPNRDLKPNRFYTARYSALMTKI
ncbi:hypothetical protein J6590_038001 [Homalodisca vitripennis]|nr:hypothetical protein J6590_038001 [Homalodisca vitripennis]